MFAAQRLDKYKYLYFLIFTFLASLSFSPAFAQAPSSDPALQESHIIGMFERWFTSFVDGLASILFYPVFGFPFIVLWLIVGGVFFTLRLRFINIRMFKHAIAVVRGKYSSPDDPGEVTHFQALAAAVSATVGLGNIAGVAVAVAMGGPGAILWMMIAGLLGMSMKFSEVTLGQKYRHFDERGRVSGGAFHYLKDGLSDMGLAPLGKVLAVLFAICCIGGSLGGGNMFQANQSVKMLTSSFQIFSDLDWAISLVMAVAVGTVLIGGIKRIANVAEALVPLMAVLYMASAFVVLFVNAHLIPDAVSLMITEAFTPAAAGGGMMGAIINGFRRAAFSNEAGVGSAPIAHAAAKTGEPVREGCVGLLEPFIDTFVICFITGLVITTTGVYNDQSFGGDGALLTGAAFATVIDWFPMVLSICVVMFAYSTMITWSYYGERAWQFLFGPHRLGIYHVIFVTATFFGGVINFGVVLDFSDLMILAMALPNLIGVYLLSNKLVKEVNEYTRKLKAGEFKVYE